MILALLAPDMLPSLPSPSPLPPPPTLPQTLPRPPPPPPPLDFPPPPPLLAWLAARLRVLLGAARGGASSSSESDSVRAGFTRPFISFSSSVAAYFWTAPEFITVSSPVKWTGGGSVKSARGCDAKSRVRDPRVSGCCFDFSGRSVAMISSLRYEHYFNFVFINRKFHKCITKLSKS